MIGSLALGGPDATARCSAYLSEESDVVARRQELSGKKTSLERARMELMNVSFDDVTVVEEEEEEEFQSMCQCLYLPHYYARV